MFTLSTDRGALCRARGLACLEGRLALPRRRPLVRVAVRVVAEGGARLRRLLRRRGHAAHALAEVVLGRVVVAVEAALARVGRRRRRRPVVVAAAVRVVVVVARAVAVERAEPPLVETASWPCS